MLKVTLAVESPVDCEWHMHGFITSHILLQTMKQTLLYKRCCAMLLTFACAFVLVPNIIGMWLPRPSFEAVWGAAEDSMKTQ